MNGDEKSDVTAKNYALRLPDAPANLAGPVKAWEEDVPILTYLPEKPDPNPMFLEKRVYQGSSGRVYPLPFIDRIATEPQTKLWKALHIENEYLRVMILPEIGGRIHVGYDKTTGYDFFYRQNVIKPALVGLAGPWISGGVEFNWPQHHRPATFMPVNTEIEHHADGSITVWCSDHDPMMRMKGMHGICLHPGRSLLELKVRLYNRTPFTQTFLWWANVAARVHEQYQSFFPTDANYVADHAKRAVTTFPLSNSRYYGVDYGERAKSGVPDHEKPRMFRPDGSYAANDLSWYANIPVPTSYMIGGTEADFFGGYDHRSNTGFVHVANHHIAPGKKQWTWGNHEFGYAWDRSLSDDDGPYIELMAGVYTDNQPDFSYLAPWETKTFTQNWFPIHAIGVPRIANTNGALSLSIQERNVSLGICVTRAIQQATIVLSSSGSQIAKWTRDLSVAEAEILSAEIPTGIKANLLHAAVYANGVLLLEYAPETIQPAKSPIVAQEPADPEQIPSIEELYLTGVHLEQYRHATRLPELYWSELLRRDPGDSRAHNRLGLWRMRRGELKLAVEHFEAAIARLTHLNPNPYDSEPYYNLGIALRYLGKQKEAYDAFYKSTWNAAWRGPAYFALAEIDAARADWELAADHLRRTLAVEAENLNARNLLTEALQHLGDSSGADILRDEILSTDPLDIIARWRKGVPPANGQERLDIAFDFLRAGLNEDAMKVLKTADVEARDGSAPILVLTLAHVQGLLGLADSDKTFQRFIRTPLDYAFPNRLEEMLILEAAASSRPESGAVHYLLGNFFYDRRRHDEAILAWEKAAALLPSFATAWRNLGIAYFNCRHDEKQALEAFDCALETSPLDGRILYERDQLWKRVGKPPEHRLNELLNHMSLVENRDDLSLELATLFNQIGRPQEALKVLLGRKFQPWEGGEGLVLTQYVRTRLLIGQRALDEDDADEAIRQFHAAVEPPHNLGEAKHLLANQSDIYYWLGVANEHLGAMDKARACWQFAAAYQGDFQQMSVRRLSDMTYWSALAHRKLGDEADAAVLLQELYDYSMELQTSNPKIDYFATSLPAMLLFEEDLRRRKLIEANFLRAQALVGFGRFDEAEDLLMNVLNSDRNHAHAADLVRQLRAPNTAGIVR
jgi:tetratricopeptide (TPR) repeat protein